MTDIYLTHESDPPASLGKIPMSVIFLESYSTCSHGSIQIPNCCELSLRIPPAPPCSTVLPPKLSAAASQGFRLFGLVASLGGAVFREFGISRIPGIGCPVVISSTIRAKDVGYDASTFSGVGVKGAESASTCGGAGGGALPGKSSLLTTGVVVSTDW